MRIAEGQHGDQLLFFGFVEPAGGFEFLWIFIGPEQHVPPDNVSVIIFVPLMLMMNAVHLRTLKKITDPAGRPDACMEKNSPMAVQKVYTPRPPPDRDRVRYKPKHCR